MRVVADSNIFVSALRFGGKPEEFLQASESQPFELIVSEPIRWRLRMYSLANFTGVRIV